MLSHRQPKDRSFPLEMRYYLLKQSLATAALALPRAARLTGNYLAASHECLASASRAKTSSRDNITILLYYSGNLNICTFVSANM